MSAISIYVYADRPAVYQKTCFKGQVINVEKSKNDDGYYNEIIQYGRNQVYRVYLSDKLETLSEKFFSIQQAPQSWFGKQQYDVVNIYNTIAECNQNAKPLNDEVMNTIKSQCTHFLLKCLEWYGYYRVKSESNIRIYKNEYENYIEVEVRYPATPSEDAEFIQSIKLLKDFTKIDYRPNRDKCFYLNVPSHRQSFSDWLYVLTKCD